MHFAVVTRHSGFGALQMHVLHWNAMALQGVLQKRQQPGVHELVRRDVDIDH